MTPRTRKSRRKNDLNLVYRRVSDLVPYEDNAKVHEDYDVGVIAHSIETFGFRIPFVIDKDNRLVAGHGRRLAVMKLGRQDEEFPCVLIEDLSPELVDLFRLTDNTSSEKAAYDYEVFDRELERLQEFEDLPQLDLLGFDLGGDDAEDGEEGEEASVAVPDPPDETPVEEKDDKGEKTVIICPHCGKAIEL